MGYIEEIRSIVGNRPLILTASAIVITDHLGRVLLQHRSDTNNWGVPGGFLELGESVEEAAKREALEETGLIVDNLRLHRIFSGEKFFFEYPNGDKVYNVIVCFIAHDVKGDLTFDHESLDLRYFHLSNLPEQMIPTSKLMLDTLKQEDLKMRR